MIGSALNLCGVVGFALSMLLGSTYASYLTSMLIGFGFVLMASAYHANAGEERKAAANAGLAFAVGYLIIILLVYFAQVTAVHNDPLNAQATQILDYSAFGLFFSYDLLGYALMALSTFFIGLTLNPAGKSDKALKILLLVHGVFAVFCFILPMLGVFSPDMAGADWIGVAVLEFWCAYFIPVGFLSFRYFQNKT